MVFGYISEKSSFLVLYKILILIGQYSKLFNDFLLIFKDQAYLQTLRAIFVLKLIHFQMRRDTNELHAMIDNDYSRLIPSHWAMGTFYKLNLTATFSA